MNQYEADISQIIKEMFPKEKSLNVPELLRTLYDGSVQMQNNPYVIANVSAGILKDSGIAPTPDNVQTVLRNAPIQMVWELMNILYGTSIYIKDSELINAMLRTDIDALMGDVRLPFPICEFVFPEHHPLGIDDYDISGCLLIDLDTAPIKLLMEQYPGKWEIQTPPEVKKVFFTRLLRKGKSDVAGISWLQFDPAQSLDILPVKVPLRQEDSRAIHILCKLCFGLCLYCQTAEGQKSLEKFELPNRACRKGSGPTEMRAYKDRKHYVMRDLITHKFRESSIVGIGTHASPKTHWRKLHLRTLRHERYNRNPDGSIRAVWIRAALINPSFEIAHGERVLSETR